MKTYRNILIIMLIAVASFSDGINGQGKNTSEMVKISSGYYRPIYQSAEMSKLKVPTFYMDIYAVTNADFVEFVKTNPNWQRSKVKRIFADESYLKHWRSDTELGEKVNPRSPVTNISWFAANAYAKWKVKRLPTISEWEYAASVGKNKPNTGSDTELIKTILNWYSKRSLEKLPPVGTSEKNYWGVYDLHGMIWEWVYDFNNVLVSGESRGDTSIESNFFCGSGSLNAIDTENYPAFMRFGFRSSLKANYCVNNLGFRCAQDIK